MSKSNPAPFEVAARNMIDAQDRINEVSRLIDLCDPEMRLTKDDLRHEMIELMLSRDIISLQMGWLSKSRQ